MEETTLLEKEVAESETLAARFSQADVDRIVKDRLERERQAREKAFMKGKQDAEEVWLLEGQALRQQLEEQRLRISELEPLGEKARSQAAALKGLLEEQKKTLPRAILPLLEKLDEVEQLNYLTAHRGELGLAGISGIPASTSPTGASQGGEENRLSVQRGRSNLYEHF